jgi:hypothetical protein
MGETGYACRILVDKLLEDWGDMRIALRSIFEK